MWEFISILFIAILTIVTNIYFLVLFFVLIAILSVIRYIKIKNENNYKNVQLATQFAKKHKFLTSFLLVLFSIFVFYIILPPFVAIRLPTFGTVAPTGTIVFDRWQMNRVDRIEIMRANGEIYLLNEQQIDSFVRATMVACRVAVGDMYVGEENNIRLYRGDVLVREMASGKHHIRVYTPSSTHWFFLSRLREPRNRSSITGGYVNINDAVFAEFRCLGLF